MITEKGGLIVIHTENFQDLILREKLDLYTSQTQQL